MPVICWHFQRSCHLVPDQMNRIEMMCKLDEVAIVVVIAGPSPIDAIMHIGRSGHEAKVDILLADGDLFGSVARGQRELRRDGFQRLRDDAFI